MLKQLSDETDWFSSDLHLGHKPIVEDRGFSSIEEMDEAVIRSINSSVQPLDRLYLLGDISFHKQERTAELLNEIHCKNIILVRGNHDKVLSKPSLRERFFHVDGLLRKTFRLVYDHGESISVPMTLSHDPLYVWDRMHHGAFQLHGHSHGSCIYPSEARQLDVGWDIYCRPLSLIEVYSKLIHKPIPIRDWHIYPGRTEANDYREIRSSLEAIQTKITLALAVSPDVTLVQSHFETIFELGDIQNVLVSLGNTVNNRKMAIERELASLAFEQERFKND